eukprot:scaffold11042_cov137-Isochrysis_galbana.AAC.7
MALQLHFSVRVSSVPPPPSTFHLPDQSASVPLRHRCPVTLPSQLVTVPRPVVRHADGQGLLISPGLPAPMSLRVKQPTHHPAHAPAPCTPACAPGRVRTVRSG